MNENEKPALGSTEAAVLTVVELIARAAQMSEQHMSYWLDLYYQVRFKHEAVEIYGELCTRTAEPDSVIVKLDELKDMIRDLDKNIRRADSKPVDYKIYPVDKDIKRKWLEQAAAEAVDRTVNAIDVSAMLGKEQEQHGGDTPGVSSITADTNVETRPWHSIVPPTPPDHYPPAPPRPGNKAKEATDDATSSDAARHLPLEGKAEEDPTPVMRGRETIKLQERAKSETRSEAVKKQKAAEREFKIRVAERLREARTHGVKVGDIVTASCGAVPDGAVLTILDGGFRPIADYRALDAALDQLAKDNTSSVTAEP